MFRLATETCSALSHAVNLEKPTVPRPTGALWPTLTRQRPITTRQALHRPIHKRSWPFDFISSQQMTFFGCAGMDRISWEFIFEFFNPLFLTAMDRHALRPKSSCFYKSVICLFCASKPSWPLLFHLSTLKTVGQSGLLALMLSILT